MIDSSAVHGYCRRVYKVESRQLKQNRGRSEMASFSQRRQGQMGLSIVVAPLFHAALYP